MKNAKLENILKHIKGEKQKIKFLETIYYPGNTEVGDMLIEKVCKGKKIKRNSFGIPINYEELVNLPGVGSKTANCVLVYAFKIPAIPVDVHINRIVNRLGWVKTKTPEKTEQALKEILPKDLWLNLQPNDLSWARLKCGYNEATGFKKLQGIIAAHLPQTWVDSGRSNK